MMKKSAGISVVALGLGIVLVVTVSLVTAPANAQDGLATAAVAMVLPAAGDGDAEYVGSHKCKMCHMKESKSWKDSKKYSALDTLEPGKAEEAKKAHGLDPSKDYTQDATCVACHTTGYGKAGGYAIPEAGDKKAEKHAKRLAGVGCESCHGPGSKYIDFHKEIMKSGRTYTREEMYEAGMTKIEESTCTACHNDKSPTFESFDFAAMKDKGAHEHFELKQRAK